jgi:hypothetical protein
LKAEQEATTALKATVKDKLEVIIEREAKINQLEGLLKEAEYKIEYLEG